MQDDDFGFVRGCMAAIVLFFGTITCLILAALWLHETNKEDQEPPRCVDESGHFERECP